jgi:tetratricopeptide (TPR) repeat protein/O-antigen ligase
MSEQRRYYIQLAGRSIVTLIVAYALALGGTYNGLLIGSLQTVSLVILSVGVIVWAVNTRRGSFVPQTLLDGALALWGIAYTISALHNPSGRVLIGAWYVGLYAGVWFVLNDLRLPGRWITDAALFTSIPLIVLALAQVANWFPECIAVRRAGIDVAFVPPRPISSLGNPNVLGVMLAMLLPLGVVRARWSVRALDRRLWMVWEALAVAVLYLTASRGAWFGAAGALGVLGWITLRQAGRLRIAAWWADRSPRTRIGLAGAGVIVIGVLLIALVISRSEFETPRRGGSERLDIYRVALDTFELHPLTGSGPFTFGLAWLENRSVPPEQPHTHAHDLVLNVAAEMGLPGLVALVVTLVLIFRGWRRALRAASGPAEKAQVAACGAALVAFGLHGLVDMPMMVPAVMLLMLGILAAGITTPARPAAPGGVGRLLARWVPPVLWIAVLGAGWWSARVYADYVRGERFLFDGDYSAGAETLRRVTEQQPFIALHEAAYGYACGLAAAGGDTTWLAAGIGAYQRALDMEAPHADWWANLAALYWQNDQRDQAVDAMRQATRYAADDPGMWLNLGVYYESQGKRNQAEAAYRRVLENDPAWQYAPFWTETALRRSVLSESVIGDIPFVRAQALWQAGQRTAAMDVFQAEIRRDPTQPAPYFGIARLYLADGDLERARDYLDAGKLLVHNPINQAWSYAVEAELARAEGDTAQLQSDLARAGDLILPDQTGTPVYLYGRDIAHLQFLRVTVRGSLLPQVHTLGPDPVLREWLETIYASSAGG